MPTTRLFHAEEALSLSTFEVWRHISATSYSIDLKSINMAAPKTGLRHVVGNAVKATVLSGAVAVGTFFIYVRGTKEVPLSTSNKIFKSAEFQHYNPNNNPTTHDLVVKRIPIDYLKEEFRRDQGKLTEKFCAGVWGGLGKFPG